MDTCTNKLKVLFQVSILLIAGTYAFTIENTKAAQHSEVLSLESAIDLALNHHPGLKAAEWETKALEAEQLQAGLITNPELEVEFENFAGSGEFSGTESTETTIGLSQLVELGGKRSKRTQVAQIDVELTKWDYTSKKLDVIASVQKDFISALATQEKVGLWKEILGITNKTHLAVLERVKAGKISPVEAMKAEVELESASLALRQEAAILTSKYQSLVRHWGTTQPTFSSLVGPLKIIEDIPTLSEYEERLAANPDIARWSAELNQKEASLNLERANAIPDIVLGGAIHHANDIDDYGFVAGISIPLSIFQQNQGSIQAANSRLQKTQHQHQEAIVEIRTQLLNTYQSLAMATDQIRNIQQTLLPTAKRAYKATEEGFQRGKFDYLDVLDTQRTLLEIRQNELSTKEKLWITWIELERLTGQPDLKVSLSDKESDHENE